MHVSLRLHGILERADAFAVRDESSDLRGRRVAADEVPADVALDAARVVPVAVCLRVARGRGVGESGHRTIDRHISMSLEEEGKKVEICVPKIDFHVLERSAGDTSTTITSRFHSVTVMRYLLTLSTHAGLAAVEKRRSFGCGPASPVPVWLGAVIIAFYS